MISLSADVKEVGAIHEGKLNRLLNGSLWFNGSMVQIHCYTVTSDCTT